MKPKQQHHHTVPGARSCESLPRSVRLLNPYCALFSGRILLQKGWDSFVFFLLCKLYPICHRKWPIPWNPRSIRISLILTPLSFKISTKISSRVRKAQRKYKTMTRQQSSVYERSTIRLIRILNHPSSQRMMRKISLNGLGTILSDRIVVSRPR